MTWNLRRESVERLRKRLTYKGPERRVESRFPSKEDIDKLWEKLQEKGQFVDLKA